MRTLAIVCAVLALAATQALAVTVAMDQQINLGYTYNTQSPGGNAIYSQNQPDGSGITFVTDGTGTFARKALTTGNGGGSWFYANLDLSLAGVTTAGNGIDATGGGTVEFDVRFFQDFETNTNPYGDAPIFLRLYDFDATGNGLLGYRDYSIVWAVQAPWNGSPYPAWNHVTVNINDPAAVTTSTFLNIDRVRWYGTDWSGTGFDFVDLKNLTITPTAVPEPGSMLALVAGLAGIVPVIRRKK